MLVVALDVDGTLTSISISWLLAHLMLGSRQRAKKNFDFRTKGHITYGEWTYRELYLCTGLPDDTFNKILSHSP